MFNRQEPIGPIGSMVLHQDAHLRAPGHGSRNNLTGPLDNALGSSVAWAYCDVPICGTVTYDCQYMEVRARWKPSHSVIAENMVIMRPYRKQI